MALRKGWLVGILLTLSLGCGGTAPNSTTTPNTEAETRQKEMEKAYLEMQKGGKGGPNTTH